MNGLYPIPLRKTGKGTSKTLQLRIFWKLEVTEDVTFGEVLGSSGNACSHLSRVPPQSFSSTPARFRQRIFVTVGFTQPAYRTRGESQIPRDLHLTQNRFFYQALPCQNGLGQGVSLQEIPDRLSDQ